MRKHYFFDIFFKYNYKKHIKSNRESMKNAIKKCIFVCSVLCSAVFWSSCQDNLEYYDTPDNLKGSIYETLEDRGNYSIFLKGVDLGGYAPILKGKGVWTVMAPNDEAFASYL